MIGQDVRNSVLILAKEGKSLREIATALKIGKTTVSAIIKKGQTESQVTAVSTIPSLSEVTPKPSIISPVLTEEMNDAFVEEFSKSLEMGPATASKGKSDDTLLDNIIGQLEIEAKPKKAKASGEAKKSKKAWFSSETIEPLAKAKPLEKKVPEDKGRLIAKITMNADSFEIVLKDVLRPNKEEFINSLHKKTQTELLSILETIEFTRTVGNTANQLKHLTFMGASGLELVSKKFLKLKSDGYADIIRAQEKELESIFKEIAMKNADGMLSQYQSPEIRLSTLLVTSLLAVDARNRAASLNQTVNNASNYANL